MSLKGAMKAIYHEIKYTGGELYMLDECRKRLPDYEQKTTDFILNKAAIVKLGVLNKGGNTPWGDFPGLVYKRLKAIADEKPVPAETDGVFAKNLHTIKSLGFSVLNTWDPTGLCGIVSSVIAYKACRPEFVTTKTGHKKFKQSLKLRKNKNY